jgi:hypothetical protein
MTPFTPDSYEIIKYLSGEASTNDALLVLPQGSVPLDKYRHFLNRAELFVTSLEVFNAPLSEVEEKKKSTFSLDPQVFQPNKILFMRHTSFSKTPPVPTDPNLDH